MTRWTMDPGDTAFPDGERLHEAFAEEVDRPGLEGPAFDLVLRSGTARLRRRRAGFGATFAVAGVAAVATATLATGGMSHDANSAAAANTSTSTNADTSTIVTVPGALSTDLAAPAQTSSSTTADPPAHPDDAVLDSGTVDDHHWQLVRRFTLNQPISVPDDPAGTTKPQWCGSLDVVVDGVWTNSGSGDTACLNQDGKPTMTANPDDPGYTTIAILDPQHNRLGAITAGSISARITSVTAKCGAQTLTDKPSQPDGDVNAYYTFAFTGGVSCPAGSLSFFNASGSRTAFLPGLSLSGGK
jgi:hypothetical protein